jgi:outer membrane beta-barrel protein
MTNWTKTSLQILVVLSAAVGSPALARKGPLDGAPAVRHKIELRDKRFELVPSFELSVAHDYKNVYSPGLRAEFHLTDSLSFGGSVMFGVPVDSGLTKQINDSLPDTDASPNQLDPVPTKNEFKTHLNEMTWHGGAHVTLTPWFGKLALFSKAYLNFDIYFRGGLGFAQLSNDWDGAAGRQDEPCPPSQMPPCFIEPNNDGPQNDGFRAGLLIGGGLHIFINNWMAADIGFHDYLFKDNPSGLDFDGDRDVDDDDSRFLSHLFFGVGISMYLPARAKISD